MSRAEDPEELVGPVARIIQIMRCLAEGPVDWSLADLSERLGLPRSTMHRLLNLLKAQGIVSADPTSRRYSPGLEFFRMAAILSTRLPVVRVAEAVLQEVVHQCDETALLGLYLPERRQMMFAAKVDCRNPVRYVLEMYVPQPIAWGATGRAILAHLPDAEVDLVMAVQDHSPATGQALPDTDGVRQDLAEIRRRGYAFTHGQRIPDAVGIAVPFFGADGKVAGDLCLTIPEFRFQAGSETDLAALLTKAAAQLSHRLGNRTH